MDAFQRTLFPGSGDSVDDDACSVYTVEMVSGALGQHELRATPVPSAGLACRVEDFSRIGLNRPCDEARSEREPFLAFPTPIAPRRRSTMTHTLPHCDFGRDEAVGRPRVDAAGLLGRSGARTDVAHGDDVGRRRCRHCDGSRLRGRRQCVLGRHDGQLRRRSIAGLLQNHERCGKAQGRVIEANLILLVFAIREGRPIPVSFARPAQRRRRSACLAIRHLAILADIPLRATRWCQIQRFCRGPVAQSGSAVDTYRHHTTRCATPCRGSY